MQLIDIFLHTMPYGDFSSKPNSKTVEAKNPVLGLLIL